MGPQVLGPTGSNQLQVTVMIPFNDDPFGVFILDPECLEREVAEDVLSEDAYVLYHQLYRSETAGCLW